MKKYALPLAIALALLFFGCVGSSLPQQCVGMPQARLANCVYVNAVLEQNPYYCYGMADIAQRAECLKGASDQSMKTLLERMLPSERDRIMEVISEQGTAAGAKEQAGKQTVGQGGVEAGNAGSEEFAGESASDKDIRTYAIDNSDVAACEQITGGTLRKSCISQIATMKKQPEICDALTVEENKQLCNMYSLGG